MSRILIVEDEIDQRKLFAWELKNEGHVIDEASNGIEGIRLAQRNDYDLVIMDIKMPELDGLEALYQIIKMNNNTPVIIHTAYSLYKSNFLTWAADAYVVKSSDLSPLLEKVQAVLMQ